MTDTRNALSAKELYVMLGLTPIDYDIPDDIEKEIKAFASSFVKKNRLSIHVRTAAGPQAERILVTTPYPIDETLIYNRARTLAVKALQDGAVLKPSGEAKNICFSSIHGISVDFLLTKTKKYIIMLKADEERALCLAYQKAVNENNQVDVDEISRIAISFLTPRINVIYKRYTKALQACRASEEDAAQEIYTQLFKLLYNFNPDRTTVGLSKRLFSGYIKRALTDTVMTSRTSPMAQDTWRKVEAFAKDPDAMKMTRREIRDKYHCAEGLVDIMYAHLSGSLELAMDATISHSTASRETSFVDMMPSKPSYYETSEVQDNLKDILTDEQFKVVMLKLQGYNQEAIAKTLGYPNKRRSQYVYTQAKKVIAQNYGLNPDAYKSKAKKKKNQNQDV